MKKLLIYILLFLNSVGLSRSQTWHLLEEPVYFINNYPNPWLASATVGDTMMLGKLEGLESRVYFYAYHGADYPVIRDVYLVATEDTILKRYVGPVSVRGEFAPTMEQRSLECYLHLKETKRFSDSIFTTAILRASLWLKENYKHLDLNTFKKSRTFRKTIKEKVGDLDLGTLPLRLHPELEFVDIDNNLICVDVARMPIFESLIEGMYFHWLVFYDFMHDEVIRVIVYCPDSYDKM